MVGGGSGGHVTPILAIIESLHAIDCTDHIEVWTDRKYYTAVQKLMHQAALPVVLRTVSAGKFRRYHNTSIFAQIRDIPTIFHNISDSVRVVFGFMQSFIRFLYRRPDILFLKGGFVCLPVGFAARCLRIPYIIHDSDVHPGLTNRLLAKHAKAILTGAPLDNYRYQPEKSVYVGIPIDRSFMILSETQKKSYKTSLHLKPEQPLVVVTGGGLGASRVNQSIRAIADELLAEDIAIVHLCCSKEYSDLKEVTPSHPSYHLIAFIDNPSLMAKLLGSADIVVSRAGATTLAELAAVAAPTILLPNAQLTGGHQTKNANSLLAASAAQVLDEKAVSQNPHILKEAILSLAKDSAQRQLLSANIHEFFRADAAQIIAHIIMKKGVIEGQ